MSNQIRLLNCVMLFCVFFVGGTTAQSQDRYTCPEVGWSIQIPSGWDITLQDQIATEDDYTEAQSALEEVVANDIPMEAMKYLIFFQKDPVNSFISTLTKRDFNTYEEWSTVARLEEQDIISVIVIKGIQVDTISSEVEINGLPFRKLDVKLFNKEKFPFMRQEYYSTYMNGYELGTVLSYNNNDTQAILRKAWLDSKFTK